MASIYFRKLLPHLLAIICFVLVAFIFCSPVLDGLVLNQHDIVGWKGMAQNAFEYKEKSGHFPLWNTHLFSGMPNYQVAMEGDSIMPNFVNLFSLGLPKPINFLFVAAICFYILALTMRLSPSVGIFGGLAYMLSTYNPIIISVGHESKMWALAFLPLLFAGVIALFEKRYWIGTALTVYGIFQQIAVNHFQITYYALIIGIAVFIAYLTSWIKRKEWKHTGRVLGIGISAALLGVAGNALILLTTSEYTRYTMRGGKNLEITGDSVKKTKTTGLDYDYASRYSISMPETAVLAMPDAFGAKSSNIIDENSHVIKNLSERNLPANDIINYVIRSTNNGLVYWGGIVEGTSGPPYVGAITFLLAIIGFLVIKSPLRWGLLAASVFGILLSWGKYLFSLNSFLFEHLPLYNKFRAPSMALTILEFTLPLVAVLALHQILFRTTSEELKKQFKTILYTAGGSLALLLLMGLSMSYGVPLDKQIMDFAFDKSGSKEINQLIIAGLKADRQDMFMSQVWQYAGYLFLTVGCLYLYARKWIHPIVAVAILSLVCTIDLCVVGKKYLGDEAYVEATQYESENFSADAIDQQLKTDPDPHFRVFNLLGDPYTDYRTSYFHRSIGGYHPAKLRIYQDLIDRYMSQNINTQILDMLDTKYVIQPGGENQPPLVSTRPTALGAAWLVKSVRNTTDPADALQSIGNLNLKDTAVIESSSPSTKLPAINYDSTAQIKLVRMDNDTLSYQFSAGTPQFVVFSEIYYPKGWNAYIDGKKAEYYKTNYVLRGMPIPAGKHEIQFVFEPSSYDTGNRISYFSSILILLIMGGSLFMALREYLNKGTSA